MMILEIILLEKQKRGNSNQEAFNRDQESKIVKG